VTAAKSAHTVFIGCAWHLLPNATLLSWVTVNRNTYGWLSRVSISAGPVINPASTAVCALHFTTAGRSKVTPQRVSLASSRYSRMLSPWLFRCKAGTGSCPADPLHDLCQVSKATRNRHWPGAPAAGLAWPDGCSEQWCSQKFQKRIDKFTRRPLAQCQRHTSSFVRSWNPLEAWHGCRVQAQRKAALQYFCVSFPAPSGPVQEIW